MFRNKLIVVKIVFKMIRGSVIMFHHKMIKFRIFIRIQNLNKLIKKIKKIKMNI